MQFNDWKIEEKIDSLIKEKSKQLLEQWSIPLPAKYHIAYYIEGEQEMQCRVVALIRYADEYLEKVMQNKNPDNHFVVIVNLETGDSCIIKAQQLLDIMDENCLEENKEKKSMPKGYSFETGV